MAIFVSFGVAASTILTFMLTDVISGVDSSIWLSKTELEHVSCLTC